MKKIPSAPGDRGLRRRAEAALRKRATRGARGGGGGDLQRLVQELQIHQIELEMQNEELTQSKAALDAGLEKYTDLYDFAPLGYFTLDERGLILDVNLTGSTLLGVEKSRLIGRRFQFALAPSSRPVFNDFLDRTVAGHERQVCEASLLRSGGAAFWADLQAISTTDPGGARKGCRMAVIDATVRKRVEEAQRRIDFLAATNQKLEDEVARRRIVEADLTASERTARQLLAQSRILQDSLRRMSYENLLEQENLRKEISHELHDKISQLLIGINVRLGLFTQSVMTNPKDIRRSVGPLRRLVAKSVRTVHDFARDLRPAVLDDIGLVPALNAHVRAFCAGRHWDVQFAGYVGAEALDGDSRTAIYRIAQEALVNIAKHARAKSVKVLLLKAPGGVCLEISDDGRAFDVGAVLDTGLGLNGMRERAEMAGGRFSVVSTPGKGTTVRAEIPFGGRKRGK
jgi:PAS domain S-box-containing protein